MLSWFLFCRWEYEWKGPHYEKLGHRQMPQCRTLEWIWVLLPSLRRYSDLSVSCIYIVGWKHPQAGCMIVTLCAAENMRKHALGQFNAHWSLPEPINISQAKQSFQKRLPSCKGTKERMREETMLPDPNLPSNQLLQREKGTHTHSSAGWLYYRKLIRKIPKTLTWWMNLPRVTDKISSSYIANFF